MKKIYTLLFVAGFWGMMLSCDRDDIMLYTAGDYIQFVKNLVDSSTCSFLAYPDDNQLLFPVVVEVVGKPSTEDRNYKIVVADEYTNATTANYDLPASFVMKAGKVIDTCWVTFKKTDEIATRALRLSLKLEVTPDFRLGQTDRLGNIIYVSNMIAKPDWWNSTVTNSYLGEYSDKKYRLFIQETGMADIDSDNTDELRYYTIIFKNYLLKEKDKGTPVKEENGMEMTVELIGG
ncbi:DUF4843 domain-containing protein [uncultured Sanguibacteroides sp.]|uniref:DUF4843 domain-containing protein n=1 Tax=uncultured Sanguibacteroides sp. TaxID=1635151 RepID=UPI0025F287D5|nr:DUF4843 domain-containing protein [uncultured Sanguibacteroides sp.]